METSTQQTTQQDSGSLIERLFKAGAHFGFSKSRRHPTAAPYLFANKQGTDIFDLEKTSELLTSAAEYLRAAGKEGKPVLFVGTKEEVRKTVHDTAVSLDALFVTNRWIGGTLTNFSEVKKRIDRLASLRSQRESGELERKYTKKERLMLAREVEKLEFNFGGVAEMTRLPGVMVVVDPRHDILAVKEAQLMNIPVVAIMSSDCDATMVTKPVFVNDAHTASVSLALDELAASYKAGSAEYVPKPEPRRERTGAPARPRTTSTR